MRPAWTRGGCDADARGTLRSFAAHQQAVETLVNVLKPHGNWLLDLANDTTCGTRASSATPS